MRSALHAGLLLVLLAAMGCSSQKRMEARGYAQGSTYAIIYYNDGTDLQYAIDSVLAAYDRVLSTYQDNSFISKWNDGRAIGAPQPEWFTDVVGRSMDVTAVTNGAFDITVKPLMDLWFGNGWDASAMDSATVDSILAFIGPDKLQLVEGRFTKTDPRVQLDVNAIAQGHSVDVVAQMLTARGCTSFLVEIGGEIFAKGSKPDGTSWKVGIDRPQDDGNPDRDLSLSLALKDRGLATSGNYRKYIEVDGRKMGHTIDPRQGWPATTDVLSATVTAPDAATADAFATAFMVMGVDLSKQFISGNDRLEGILIYEQNGELLTWVSAGIANDITD
jgi:FAD:protein FMN transferase